MMRLALVLIAAVCGQWPGYGVDYATDTLTIHTDFAPTGIYILPGHEEGAALHLADELSQIGLTCHVCIKRPYIANYGPCECKRGKLECVMVSCVANQTRQ